MICSNPIYKNLEEAERRGQLVLCLLSCERSVRKNECGTVLSELHNAGKISLVSDLNLTAIKALEPIDFWSVVNSFEQAIPDLDCSYQDVLVLVQALAEKAGSGGATISLIKWCNANPEQAKIIIEESKLLDPVCISYCCFALQGIGNPDLAFELMNHPNAAVISAGLRSLGMLNVLNSDLAIRIIDECCSLIKVEKNEEIRSSAIETAFNTWGKVSTLEAYRQKEFLNVIINEKSGSEIIQLSAALFHHQKALISETVDQILRVLVDDISDPAAALRWLDSALHSKDEKWNFTSVLDVITAQIPKLNNPIGPSDLYHFCEWIWEDKDNASLLFSRWFVSGQVSLCKLLAKIVGENRKGSIFVEISKIHLPPELNDQIFFARKCVGYLWFYEVTAASLLLSVVKNGHKSARETAEELLYNPLLLCYGGNLRNFLEQQITNPSKRISDCVGRLLERHDSYLSGLKQTSSLVEFLPTPERRRAAGMKDRALNDTIQKQAHMNSILSQLSSHQTLLYGRKSLCVIYGADGRKIPTVTPLSEFSYSTELPRLSVVDPVGFNEMLMIFRTERRSP